MESGWQPVAEPELFGKFVAWGLSLPHCRALGLQLESAGLGRVRMVLPFRPELVGDPQSRALHAGVATTLADTSGALAIFTRFAAPESVVTLDLRLDYLSPGRPDLPLYCESECISLTRQIAFVRSTLYQHDLQTPVAHAVATYMRTVLPVPGDR